MARAPVGAPASALLARPFPTTMLYNSTRTALRRLREQLVGMLAAIENARR